MGVIPILLWLSEAGTALAGWGCCGNLVGVALVALPKPQPQIHSGRQGGGTRQLPIPGIAGSDWYLAADDRERHRLLSYENVECLLHFSSLIKSALFSLFAAYDYNNNFLAALSLFSIVLMIRFNSARKYLQNNSNKHQTKTIIASSIVETAVFVEDKQAAIDKGFNLSSFISSMTDNCI